MIDHTGIGVADIGPPSAFFDAALGAFAARGRAWIAAFHAAAMKAGGIDNGPAGLRHGASDASIGHPGGYYATFVIDPDGNSIEAVFRGS